MLDIAQGGDICCVDAVVFLADLSSYSADTNQLIPSIIDKMKKGTKFMIIGNKVDIKSNDSVQRVSETVYQFGLEYAGVSAATGQNVEGALDNLIHQIAMKSIKMPLKEIYMFLMLGIH